MRRFLEKLRSRSVTSRMILAIAGTAALMLPILFVWGVNTTRRYSSDIQGVGDSVRQTEGITGGLGAAIQNFTGDTWSFLSNALTKPYDVQTPQRGEDEVDGTLERREMDSLETVVPSLEEASTTDGSVVDK